jgi:hypothetical protein
MRPQRGLYRGAIHGIVRRLERLFETKTPP